MFRRSKIVQNSITAYYMRRFFRKLPSHLRERPENVAMRYGRFVRPYTEVAGLAGARFNIALTSSGSASEFERVTKRATLVSDTLLLSHDGAGSFHELEMLARHETQTPESFRERYSPTDDFAIDAENSAAMENRVSEQWCGMTCPDLGDLGQWILNSEQLLKTGLTWYLPSYSIGWRFGTRRDIERVTEHSETSLTTPMSDPQYQRNVLLVREGRAVEMSGGEPMKSHLVRPVLNIDLPFIEGVDLQTFSEVTVQEFASYSAFRDFLRVKFLEIDESLNSTQSERELLKLSLEIKGEIRSARSQMNIARRKRAVSVTGAGVGSVSAILVAVYGPAFQEALAAVGASGGLWAFLNAVTDNSVRDLRENEWYYVWALDRKSDGRVI